MSSRHILPTARALDPMSPRFAFEPLPPHLERRIAERWKVWVPWVRIHLLRARPSDPSVDAEAEFRRFRERHSQHILDMLRAGISMRTIRRHRLDDPRLANEVRAVLIEAAKERQSKARFRRSEEQRKRDMLPMLIRLASIVRNAAARGSDSESHGDGSQPARVFLDPVAVHTAIQTIRQHVCARFYLREMRDPELTVRTNRRAYVLPRQVAMYIARQVTAASLQEIGREFGGRHHSTVIHALRKIEEMRRADKALDSVITRLMDAVIMQT